MGTAVELIPLKVEDARLVFDWQCDPRTRKYFRNPNPPSWDKHPAWIEKMVASDIDDVFIITYEGHPSGMIRASQKPGESGLEVSILVAPESCGHGIASAALALLDDTFPHSGFWADVHKDNATSVHVFEKAGFGQNFSKCDGVWLRYEKGL